MNSKKNQYKLIYFKEVINLSSIGFIGVGNMGEAMAKAIQKAGEHRIWIYDINKACYTKFDDGVINKAQGIQEVIENTKYVVLSIKPQYYKGVCEQIRSLINNHIIITVAPSVTVSDAKKLLGENTKIIRTMPNTPALVNSGVTAYCYDDNDVNEEEINTFIKMFECFGMVVKLEEHLMEAAVATTGSSPAYAYMFIEAMADASVSFGIPRSMAYEMAAMAIKGACEMILSTKKHPGELKDAVTSPGGTTIKAVAKLEETGFRSSVISAMEACYNKALEMGNRGAK